MALSTFLHADMRLRDRILSIILAVLLTNSDAQSCVRRQEEIPKLLAELTLEQLGQVKVAGDWLGELEPEAIQQYPGTRTVICIDEMTESGVRTVEDALRSIPSIGLYAETGTGILPNIGVRGLNPRNSEEVLVLLDDIPFTLAPYGQTSLSLFPLTMNFVEAVDVARGGVAVHYGPNNVGGLINLVSKRIPRKISLTAKETLPIAQTGHVLSDTYARVGGFFTDSFGAQLQVNGVYGQFVRDHSDTSITHLMLDTDFVIDSSSEIKAKFLYYNTNDQMPGGLTPQSYESNPDQSTMPLGAYDGDSLRGHLIYNKRFSDRTELGWTAFAHNSNRKFVFGNTTNPDAPSTEEQSTPRHFLVFGTEPRASISFNTGFEQKISIGLRYMHEEVDYLTDSLVLATNQYKPMRDWRFNDNALAIYLSDTFSLLGNRLKITPGIRREQLNLDYRNNQTGETATNKTVDFLPGLDIGYKASDSVFLFTNIHKSLRPVQFTQITYGGSLVSEMAWNYEAGMRFTSYKDIGASLSAFHFTVDNKIEFVNQTVGYRNLNKVRHQGIETEFSWRKEHLKGLNFSTRYTLLGTKQLSGPFEGNQLPYAPRHQIYLESNYRTSAWDIHLDGFYRTKVFTDSADTVNENSTGSIGQVPPYWLWNFQLNHRFSWDHREMTAGVGITNLFDREYYDRDFPPFLGRLPAPRRVFLLTLQMDT
jgi:Fe(3+) dicitrate transport protein